PFGEVELPVPEVGPVEEVADDDRQGQASAFVFAGDLQEFFLGAVAQLALPKPGGELGEHWCVSGGVGVPGEDPRGLVGRGHPVVDLSGAVTDPAGTGLGEFDPADGGTVPQEAIATGGDHEGDGDLGVSLDEVDHRTLLVEKTV